MCVSSLKGCLWQADRCLCSNRGHCVTGLFWKWRVAESLGAASLIKALAENKQESGESEAANANPTDQIKDSLFALALGPEEVFFSPFTHSSKINEILSVNI